MRILIRLAPALAALLLWFVAGPALAQYPAGNQPAAPAGTTAPRPGGPALVGTPAESSPDIKIRFGDTLFLSLPGEDTLNKTLQVDRRGNLQLPEVGLVEVAGLTIAQAQAKLKNALAKVFRDVSRFEVTLKERRLLVTVAGLVKQPGQVELPGDATVQQAINAAGGLAQGAQLDRMQVRRGKEVITFDYKKYLDNGDNSDVPILQPLDEVFVPASPLIGNVQMDYEAKSLASNGDAGDDRSSIKVFGEVNGPASFAYKPESSIIEYLMRAGGVTRFATVEGIRIIDKGQPQLFNLKEYLDTGNHELLPKIGPGATIFVPKEVEEVKGGKHTVYVMGEVFKPGSFEASPQATFLDILANAGGPTRFADTSGIRVLHVDGTTEAFDLQAFSLAKGRDTSMPKMQSGDAIFVPEHEVTQQDSWLKFTPDRIVRIIGAVKNPGRYEWNEQMNILDLIAQSGGPTRLANTSHIEVLPTPTVRGENSTITVFDLATLVDKGGRLDQLPMLKPGDTVSVPDLPENPVDNKSTWLQQSADTSIYIMGAVQKPGRYAFSRNVHFLDILGAAEGPSATADLTNVRVTHRRGGAGPAALTKVNLTLYFNSGDERMLPDVIPGDVIYVPDRNADWLTQTKEQTVRVLGAVGKPGRYKFDDSMTILDLLAEAGGPTLDAYQEKIVVVNYAQGQDQARLFNLVQFARTGDFRTLPVLRTGDTVYVPNYSQSDWRIFETYLQDIASVAALIAIFRP
jgi:protein involved in polysaccharide export with SLBB domain